MSSTPARRALPDRRGMYALDQEAALALFIEDTDGRTLVQAILDRKAGQ